MEETFIELQNAEEGVYSMKQKKLLSLFGVLIIMIGTVVVMTGCPQANGNNGLSIQPTGEADPALKGTVWKLVPPASVSLFFAEKGNTVNIDELFESVYTVNGSAISFDFSKSAQAWSTMTVDTSINRAISKVNKRIAELEALLDKEQDAVKKQEYEAAIERNKAYLEHVKNLPPEEKSEIAKSLENFKKAVKAFEPHAKFDGTFNADKMELTIEKFPVINRNDWTVEVKKVVFKKQ